jgi:hypothetical protein
MESMDAHTPDHAEHLGLDGYEINSPTVSDTSDVFAQTSAWLNDNPGTDDVDLLDSLISDMAELHAGHAFEIYGGTDHSQLYRAGINGPNCHAAHPDGITINDTQCGCAGCREDATDRAYNMRDEL